MIDAAIWPRHDYSRVPYRLYHDPEIYAREQERIFRGPVWNFLGLDCEIPDLATSARPMSARPRSSSIARDGAVKAFVNRCAHRGALVRRERPGTRTSTSASTTNGATGSTAA